jgi:hypothetical protein
VSIAEKEKKKKGSQLWFRIGGVGRLGRRLAGFAMQSSAERKSVNDNTTRKEEEEEGGGEHRQRERECNKH